MNDLNDDDYAGAVSRTRSCPLVHLLMVTCTRNCCADIA
jgi:hypothetical protein